jgi:hypothetical protein
MKSIKSKLISYLPFYILTHIYKIQYIRYINKLYHDIDPNKKTVLAINHFYDQDYEACSISAINHNFVVVNGPVLFKFAKYFFSKRVIELLIKYPSDNNKGLQQWKKISDDIFDRLDKKFNFDFIVTPSDSFYWIREFIKKGNESKISIILDKEGTISPFDFEKEAKKLSSFAPVLAKNIFVWSNRQKAYWEKIGAESSSIVVLGQPRSDLFYKKEANSLKNYFKEDLPLIVFFSYHDDAYINPIRNLNKKDPYSWVDMKSSSHEILSRMSKKYSDKFNFVIKTHPQQIDLTSLQKKYNSDNLKVIGGSSISNELIQKSRLIIGFQTTIIIEALYLNKNVIYTYWSDSIKDLENDLLPFHKASCIKIAREVEKFESMLDDFLHEPVDFYFGVDEVLKKDGFVEEYIFQPDGNCCNRFFKYIDNL